VVVEAKVASVNDIIRFCITSKIIQRPQIACRKVNIIAQDTNDRQMVQETNLAHQRCRERALLLAESHDLGLGGEVRHRGEALQELLARHLACCKRLGRRDGSD
jgi:hypothetical protein